MNSPIKTIASGAFFCLSQRIVESLIGFVLTDLMNVSDVNFEGAIQFAIIGIFLTIVPYLLTFPIVNWLAKGKINNSYISAGINLFVLVYFYKTGLIHKDPTSFAISSIFTSILLILAERKINNGITST